MENPPKEKQNKLSYKKFYFRSNRKEKADSAGVKKELTLTF